MGISVDKIKKSLCMIILAVSIMSFQCFAEFENPFTDEDYLKEDFGIKDYDEYVTDSIDNRGIRWPEGTKIISSETWAMGKDVDDDAPVFIPDDIEIIGHAAFMERNITDEMIDFSRLTKLKYIGKYAFKGTYLRRVDLSNTQVIRIGSQAFDATVTSFIASPTLKRIDDFAAPRCSLGVLKLNEGLEYIGAEAFSAVSLPTVTIPSTVKYIGYGAFPKRVKLCVAKGSYAEEWCKSNGYSYSYHFEAIKADDSDITKNIGPLKFVKYYAHWYRERKVTTEKSLPVIDVKLAGGGTIETIYDNVELYLLSGNFDINSPMTGTTDGEYFDYYGRKKILSDEDIIAHPTTKMDDGWEKGLKWELSSGKSLWIAAKFKGEIYYYNIETQAEADYQKYKTTGENIFAQSGDLYAGSTAKIIADGKEFNCGAYNIAGNNFFKLRDVAFIINGSAKQFEIKWNQDAGAMEIVRNSPYTVVGGEISPGNGERKKALGSNPAPIFCGGYQVFLEVYNIEGNNYIKLRDIAKLIDFGVEWSESDNCIVINTSASYKE